MSGANQGPEQWQFFYSNTTPKVTQLVTQQVIFIKKDLQEILESLCYQWSGRKI